MKPYETTRPLKWWVAYVILPDGTRRNWHSICKKPEFAPVAARAYKENWGYQVHFCKTKERADRIKKRWEMEGRGMDFLPVHLEEHNRPSKYFREKDGREYIIL